MNGKGRCLCGEVRYKHVGEFRPVWNCHCERCRRFTGHHIAATAVAPRAADPPGRRHAEVVRARTRPIHYGFCSRCGSSLLWKANGAPEKVCIAAGTLDQPTGLTTTTAWWTAEAADYHERQAGLIEHPHDGDE